MSRRPRTIGASPPAPGFARAYRMAGGAGATGVVNENSELFFYGDGGLGGKGGNTRAR